eukprot:TRINITY_DN3794_c0_g1_i2.p1 TRINITY_DN3794_c0_g1~~TRINITY_DN3794_c0_g1_i2.p1  ORF type:complete len:505 (+),score=68.76 TRINITY_DN3794_c0_g1_i2:190-1704(+)
MSSSSLSSSGATRGGDDPPPPADDLSRCLLIFDDLCEDESAASDQLVLYFYPPTVPLNSRLFLLGACSAMVAFVRNFTDEPAETMMLDRAKFAFRQIGKVTMVLTGRTTDDDSTIVEHLSSVYDAFRFYCGSFEAMYEQSKGDRKAFLARMHHDAERLAPLLARFHADGQKYNHRRAFNPTEPFALPNNMRRHFLTSSQLLRSVSDEPSIIGACVLYGCRILCTCFDRATTRCIQIRVEYNGRYAGRASSTHQMDGSVDFLPVWLPNQQLDRLRLVPREHRSNGPSQATDDFPEYVTRTYSDGEFVGLYSISLGELTFVMLMELPALRDEKFIGKMKLRVQSKMCALERGLVSMPPPSQPPNTIPPQDSNRTTGPGETSTAVLQYSYVAYDPLEHSTMSGRDQYSPAHDSAAIGNEHPSTSPSVGGAASAVGRDVDMCVSRVHGEFHRSHKLTRLSLRDSEGITYGCSAFGHETFFHQAVPPSKHGVSEPDVRQALSTNDLFWL